MLITAYFIKTQMTMKLIFTFLFLFKVALIFGQTPAHDMAKNLGNGYNFGNVMSANNEGDWAAPIEEFMLEDVANAGFDHIRLPVRWGSHTTEEAPYTIDPEWLTRVDEVITWATDRGLIVVLNAHGEHWFIEEVTKEDDVYHNQEKWDRFLAIWTQISAYFQRKSNDKVVFELINEPYFNMNKGIVDQLNKELLEIVREDNPDRIVMLTGGGDNAIYAPQQMDPSIFENDNKLIPWFHYYWPNTFTKYPEVSGSIPDWGTPEEYAFLKENFENVKSWADALNVPLYLGEYGSNNACSSLSRKRYHRAVVDLTEELKIPRAIWCAGPKANKMVYKRAEGEWVEGQLEALLPKNKKKNILFISIDDLNTDLLAFGNDEVITPNFDKLSEQGIQYLNAQCSYPVCGPSRASYLTGTYPEKNGVTNLTLQLSDTAPNLTTLPELLALNGYRTAAVGKVFDPRNVDDKHHEVAWTDDYKDPNAYTYPEEYGDFVQGNNYRVTPNMSYEIGPDNVDDDGYQDGQFTLEAINYLNKFSVTNQPFFLSIGFKKPHLPFIAPKKYYELYDGRELSLAQYQKLPLGTDSIAYKDPVELMGYADIPETWDDIYEEATNVLDLNKQRELILAYYACASYIDAQIGLLIAHLEAIEEAENTLIIITSDHGFNLGDHNMWGKHNLLQNSAQVPLIIIDPSQQLKPTGRAVQLIDIYPTVCDYAYVPKPSFLQGNSLYQPDDEITDYPLDLAVTYYKRNGKNGYSFKKGDFRYTFWTLNKSMSPIEVPFSDVSFYQEEFYFYSNNQELETVNEINNSNYATEIAQFKQEIEVWWNNYQSSIEAESGSNLIKTNSSFENGVEEGWTATFKSGIGIDFELLSELHPITNSKSAAFHIQTNGGNFSNLALRSDDYPIGFKTSESQKFIVKFSLYSSVDTEVKFQLQLDKGGDKINSENISIQKDSLYTIEREVTSSVEGMSSVRLLIQLGKAVGTIYIDDVMVLLDNALNDELFLTEALNATQIGFHELDHKNQVKNNIYLPLQSSHESTVKWTSQSTSLLTIEQDSGLIVTPETDQTVILEAEVQYKHLVGYKSFVITLKGEVSSLLKAVANETEIYFSEGDSAQSVKRNITLYSPDNNDVSVIWMSSDSTAIKINDKLGEVQILDTNKEVTISAVLDYEGEQLIKNFDLIVVRNREEILPPTAIIPNTLFKVYPNPTQNLLHIERLTNKQSEFKIYNLEGKIILTKTLVNFKEKINMADLKKGIYIIQINNSRKKIIKN